MTWRVRDELGNMRAPGVKRAIAEAFAEGADRFGFRLVRFCVQRHRVLLLCEAQDGQSLRRGVQGLSIRVAKAVNHRVERHGKVFADRYELRSLNDARGVQDALAAALDGGRTRGKGGEAPGWEPCPPARTRLLRSDAKR